VIATSISLTPRTNSLAGIGHRLSLAGFAGTGDCVVNG
jgi:hypothetical protein